LYFQCFLQPFAVSCCTKTVSCLLGTVCDTLENTATYTCHMSSPVLSPSGRLPPCLWFALCARPLVTRDSTPRRESSNVNEYTYLLTPWGRVLLEKQTGLQLVKKYPAYYGNRGFIAAFTSVRHLPLS